MQRRASSSQLPDRSGSTVIVTGAGSGIGLAAAKALAARGAQVVLAVRDLRKGRDAAVAIGHGAVVRRLDLASLESVREFAAGVEGAVSTLVNNAGAMAGTRHVTVDGFESQFGVNHLGHFALTNLLLGQITERVVTVTSSAARSARIDFDDLQWERRPYSPFGAYGQSKLANLLFTEHLQHLLGDAGSLVRAVAADPGYASTGFRIRTGNAIIDRAAALVTPLVARGPAGGALPTLLAVSGDVPPGSLTGPSRFGVRGPATVLDPLLRAADTATARRLWAVSERLTSTRFPLAPSRQR
jgi:NAD(P)-dependent dehydrogenase (short-subunit alcohol dehydrogenase family)